MNWNYKSYELATLDAATRALLEDRTEPERVPGYWYCSLCGQVPSSEYDSHVCTRQEERI